MKSSLYIVCVVLLTLLSCAFAAPIQPFSLSLQKAYLKTYKTALPQRPSTSLIKKILIDPRLMELALHEPRFEQILPQILPQLIHGKKRS
jgi:hypothetical protein